MRVADLVGGADRDVDHVPFGDFLFLTVRDQGAPVFQDIIDLFQVLVVPFDGFASGLYGLTVDKRHASQAADTLLAFTAQLAPAHRTGSVSDRGNLAPVPDQEATAVAADGHADDVVFQPVLVHVVEHLVMDAGGQVDGVAGFDRIALVVEQDLAAAAEYVVDLLGILVLVKVGGFAPLQGVPGKAVQAAQPVPVVLVIFAFPVTQAAPVDRAQVCDVGLHVPPVLYVCQGDSPYG